MSTTTIAVAILALALLGTIVVLVANAASRRRLSEDVPPALRPAYSDEQLETTVLERYMSWGLILTLFFAIFLPAYWLREPSRIQEKQQSDTTIAFARGETLYADNCSRCHGTNAAGGSAVSPYGGDWPAPNLTTIALRDAESRTVTDIREHVVNTIRAGRPGTPMPAWGADHGGPLTDHQIDQMADWILLNQVDSLEEPAEESTEEGTEEPADEESTEEATATPVAARSGEELYQQTCARCHGPDLEGLVGPSLVGVFERHSPDTILGILQNGINLTTSGMFMPPWGEETWYLEDSRFSEDALQRIIAYLEQRQPGELPAGADQYQTPGVGPEPGDDAPATEAPATEDAASSDTTDV